MSSFLNFSHGAASSIANVDEVELDPNAVRDVLRMHREEISISTARDSYLAMTVPGPFSWTVPKINLKMEKDMERVIGKFWVPWQKKVYEMVRMFGICPYIFEKRKTLPYPFVPDPELYTIKVAVDKKRHKVTYNLYWRDTLDGKGVSEPAKNVYWIITDRAPNRYGQLQSPLAAMLPRYRTMLILRNALQITAEQNSKISHLLEYHPKGGSAGDVNDGLTQLSANFGEKAAGLSKARQELARAQQLETRVDHQREMAQWVHQQNLQTGSARQTRLMWTDTPQQRLERLDNGFDRMVPLMPDFKYVSPSRPQVVAELERYQNAFDVDAAAAMGYAYELIRPSGAARAQNSVAAIRFITERAKEGVAFFTQITQSALIIAYEEFFKERFDEYHRNKSRMEKGGDQDEIVSLHPELDVEVHMSSAPNMTYADLRQMVQDGIMTMEDFANHAYDLYALSKDQIIIPNKLPSLEQSSKVETKQQKSNTDATPVEKPKKDSDKDKDDDDDGKNKSPKKKGGADDEKKRERPKKERRKKDEKEEKDNSDDDDDEDDDKDDDEKKKKETPSKRKKQKTKKK